MNPFNNDIDTGLRGTSPLQDTHPHIVRPEPIRATTAHEPASFATAHSHEAVTGQQSPMPSRTAEYGNTVRSHPYPVPSMTGYSPPSPSPHRGSGTAPLRMGRSGEPGAYDGDEPASQSTPAERARSAPFLCTAPSLLYASVGMTLDAPRSLRSPRDPATVYADAVTTFQSALRSQVLLRSQQLEQHTRELTNLHARSHAVLAEYANEVCAAQSRTNRALLDNQQMLQDVDLTIAESRISLGLPPMTVATATRPQAASTLPGSHMAEAPSSAPMYVETGGVRNSNILPSVSSLARSTLDGNTRYINESIDEYDARVGRAVRQQGRITQAMRPSISHLASQLDSNPNSSQTCPPATLEPGGPPETVRPDGMGQVANNDPYAPYRETYRDILNDQYERGHRQLDQFEQQARVDPSYQSPRGRSPHNQSIANPGPAVWFQNPIPTRSISEARALNAQRNQPLPIYAAGQPISILHSSVGVSAAPTSGTAVNPHLDGLLKQIIMNIRHKVGQQRLPLPEGVKQPKIEMPEKYSGANDH